MSADGMAEAHAILERRYPEPELELCAFHVGAPGGDCRRCGSSWAEHQRIPVAENVERKSRRAVRR